MSQKKSMFWNYGTYWDIRKVHDEERLLAKNQYHIAIWGWDIGSFMLQWLHTNPCNFVLVLNELRPWQTRTHCWGHIVTHDVSWARKRAGHKMNVVFPCCSNWETFVADTKCFDKSDKFICVPDTKFVSATNAARAGKRGNICVRNNVSATMFPHLPGPFKTTVQKFAMRCK